MSKLYSAEPTQEKVNGIPVFGMKESSAASGELTQDDYRVRVEKFVLGDDEGTCMQLEAVLNRALLKGKEGTQEVILLDRQQSFFEGMFFVVLTYMERRPK